MKFKQQTVIERDVTQNSECAPINYICHFIQLFHTMLLPYFYEVDYQLATWEK